MLQHLLVSRHGQRLLARLQHLQHAGVHEVGHHHVRPRVVRPQVAKNAFHSPVAGLARMSRILVVVHRKLQKEQVHRTVAQHVPLQSKGSGGGAGGGDARIGEGELGFRETLLQPLAKHGAIPVHLRDRATHERHVSLLLLLEAMQGICEIAPMQKVLVGFLGKTAASDSKQQKGGYFSHLGFSILFRVG